MTDQVLKLEGVHCSYGDQAVLHGVDLTLEPGRITAVLGRSGCGKSTMLRTIAGFEPVESGTITLGERPFSRAGYTLPPEERAVGIVVQSFALFPHLSLWKNATFGAKDDAQHDLARQLLQQVGLDDRLAAYPHELSGGEQQRIALIRALVPQPDVVLLDEAFSSLDRQLREGLRQETARLLRESGAAVCVVTHDVDEALELADHLAIMRKGQIVQQGLGEDVFWRPANAEVGRLLGDLNVLSGTLANGAITSDFGTMLAPQEVRDGEVVILIRPSAVSVQGASGSDGAARIVAKDFKGLASTVTVQSASGSSIIAAASDTHGLAVGDEVSVVCDLARATVLPR